MTFLANYWGFLFILSLVVAEATAAGIANACKRPEQSPPTSLAGPTRGHRRRGREASWL